jgi:hypothetical protein
MSVASRNCVSRTARMSLLAPPGTALGSSNCRAASSKFCIATLARSSSMTGPPGQQQPQAHQNARQSRTMPLEQLWLFCCFNLQRGSGDLDKPARISTCMTVCGSSPSRMCFPRGDAMLPGTHLGCLGCFDAGGLVGLVFGCGGAGSQPTNRRVDLVASSISNVMKVRCTVTFKRPLI